MYIPGANMHILGTNMYIPGANMYILGANMYHYGTNMQPLVQKCTFWKGTAPVTAFVPFFSESVEYCACNVRSRVIG